MLIYLLRHGETEYNVDKRYQGTRDIPLSDRGRAQLRQAELQPERVFVSPLSRARESAQILFPRASQTVIPDFREMCFGVFEGRNYIQMERDPDYLAWVGEDCRGRCPGGESRDEFSLRTCAAFARLVEEESAKGAEQLVIMAHGGTQMAVMERFARPRRDYYTWCAGNGAGYVLDDRDWASQRQLLLVGEVRYAED